jgi:hypothetical protein
LPSLYRRTVSAQAAGIRTSRLMNDHGCTVSMNDFGFP